MRINIHRFCLRLGLCLCLEMHRDPLGHPRFLVETLPRARSTSLAVVAILGGLLDERACLAEHEPCVVRDAQVLPARDRFHDLRLVPCVQRAPERAREE